MTTKSNGLRKVKPQADSASTISELSTSEVADEFFGRSQEKSSLVELIRQAYENQDCKVISVLGMGGVGKTTLVRSVYEELACLFQNNRVWITVQRPFSVDSCLKSIARQLYGPNASREIETVEFPEMIHEIARLLRMKRCLIVLDDLTSSTPGWELLITFLDAVIVVTTREYKLARQYSTDGYVFEVSLMQYEDALDLFKRKVFKKDEHYSSNHDLMEEASNIVKKCGGLPLAISVIGSFLSDKTKTKTEWKKLNSKLGISGPQQTISTILRRSYNDLPYHLKSCFLYMAIFPENKNIKRKRLIRLWVAEGYSREMRHLTAEEVADKYFGELLDRSMIMPASKVTHSTGKIYSCVLHDLIREICVLESMKEELVFTLEEGSISNTRSKVRQLAISDKWRRNKDEFERTLDLSHVRSLTVFGEWRSFFITDTMKFVRVLDLEDASGLKNHHLNQICQQVHLKYLSLRGCKDISEMPESLGNLTQLHTMDIRGTNILQLPSTFNKLRKLQQLHASAWFKGEHKVGPSRSNEIAMDKLKWRQNKLKLSFSYNNNFNFLGRQASRVVQVPRGIGKLNALRTLGYVRLGQGKGNASMKELKGLTQLRKLELHGVDRTNCRDFWSAIAGHNHLKSLSVNRDCVADDLDWCLDGILSPPKSLENLKLWGRLVRVTKWVQGQQLQYLSKLQLHRSRLDQDAIDAIGKLPNLRILRFWKSSFQGSQLKFVPESFPCLILLDLRELGTLTVVEFKDGGMPKLERLQAAGWSKLKNFLGLGYLMKLNEIQLGPSFSDELKKNVQSQLDEHPNSASLKLESADEQYTLVRDLEE
ncbi:hypothetical protein HU200_014376 [Digitaria exilis]|uniref:NB-ARC domain-containing protein n=1 Tax=Digitaria exilis TaxID=1010633 RepID=A0A835FB82_9POAL|nr:hypothetical protein HU200_014376 [Digitaria exilis]